MKNFTRYFSEHGPFWYKWDRARWWVLHRFHPKYIYHWHKFHYLEPGWHDVDNKMLHSCFDYLVEFMEEEDGFNDLKYQADYWKNELDNPTEFAPFSPDNTKLRYEEAQQVYDEAIVLYSWWKNYNLPDNKASWEDDAKDKENEMLKRLIDIRGKLWT